MRQAGWWMRAIGGHCWWASDYAQVDGGCEAWEGRCCRQALGSIGKWVIGQVLLSVWI